MVQVVVAQLFSAPFLVTHTQIVDNHAGSCPRPRRGSTGSPAKSLTSTKNHIWKSAVDSIWISHSPGPTTANCERRATRAEP